MAEGVSEVNALVDGNDSDSSVGPVVGPVVESDDVNQRVLLYKENCICYHKSFSTRASLYSVNSYKNWCYVGGMNNKCYVYEHMFDDLKNFVDYPYDDLMLDEAPKIPLGQLKKRKYTDTVCEIKFSNNFKYIGIGTLKGAVHVYENVKCSQADQFNSTAINIKLNSVGNNALPKICEWYEREEVGARNTHESLEELIDTKIPLAIFDINYPEDETSELECFMFCPYNEEVALTAYAKNANVYFWKVSSGNQPIRVLATHSFPTIFNLCNYINRHYLQVGFADGSTAVYEYNLHNQNIKRVGDSPQQRYQHSTSRFPETSGHITTVHSRTTTEAPITQMDSEDSSVDPAIVSMDSSVLNEIYAVGRKCDIEIRNINNNQLLQTINSIHVAQIENIVFNNINRNTFASCGLDGLLNVYDFNRNNSIIHCKVNYEFNEETYMDDWERGLNNLRWINSNILLFSSLSGNIYLYDIRQRNCVRQFYSHTSVIYGLDTTIHLFRNRYILSIVTAGQDCASNMHFWEIEDL